MKTLKFWGWGYEGDGLDGAEQSALLKTFGDGLGFDLADPVDPPAVAEVELAPPRLSPPGSLAEICTDNTYDRLLHTYGQSFPDSARIFARDFGVAPDIVTYPKNEAEIAAIMDWVGEAGGALIPYGGGTSVVGGTEGSVGDGYSGVVSLDLRHLDKVLEIDPVSRAARIQAGATGPGLEGQLKPAGLTLRHFPQSFELATLGGWIATRSGGHFATLYTHIDDLVESVRMVTPAGAMESFRLPGSGAGPSPDRFMMGSEGAFGVITEAWVRLQGRPGFKGTASITFADFHDAARAVRAIAQAGLYPANVRIVDGVELMVNGVGDGSFTLLVVSFESADHPVDAWMARALECCGDHGGAFEPDWAGNPAAHLEGPAGAWRNAFIRMPYNREVLTPRGVISDTFETSTTWDRFENFHGEIHEATAKAIREVTGKDGAVSCRFSHAYPDGPAPYFGFHGEGRPGDLLGQWREIKAAASEAVLKAEGTITHHHAVGRDHMEWYRRQRPDLFGSMLEAAKDRLDPDRIMNPGVIVDGK